MLGAMRHSLLASRGSQLSCILRYQNVKLKPLNGQKPLKVSGRLQSTVLCKMGH